MDVGEKLAMSSDIASKFRQDMMGADDAHVSRFLEETIASSVAQLFQAPYSDADAPLKVSGLPVINLAVERQAERSRILTSWTNQLNYQETFREWLSSLWRMDLTPMTNDQIARDIHFGMFRLKYRLAIQSRDSSLLKQLEDVSVAIVEDRLLGNRLDELKTLYGRLFLSVSNQLRQEIDKKVNVFTNYYMENYNAEAFKAMTGVAVQIEAIAGLVKRDGPLLTQAQLNTLISPNLVALRNALAPLERVDVAIFMGTVAKYAMALNGTPL